MGCGPFHATVFCMYVFNFFFQVADVGPEFFNGMFVFNERMGDTILINVVLPSFDKFFDSVKSVRGVSGTKVFAKRRRARGLRHLLDLICLLGGRDLSKFLGVLFILVFFYKV